jgi:hypothetical protein
MNKPIEYCPNCSCKRELDLSLGLVAANEPDCSEGILLYHYHCAACNTYIRSTTLDYEEYIRPHEVSILSLPVYVW